MVIKKGDRGPLVEKLQEALLRHKCDPGAVDGIFGPKTEAAVMAFENSVGFDPDGVAGEQTIDKLGLEPTPMPGTVPKETSGPMGPFNWLDGEVGTVEVAGRRHNERILYYHSFTTLHATDDETPWCSAVMCAALENTGHRSTKSAAAASYKNYGSQVDIDNFKKGDILVFKRTGGHHVCFAAKDGGKKHGSVYVLGGNQSNMVKYQFMSTGNLIAARRVKT